MRENSVPCRNATGYQVVKGRHRTFNDSRLCDRCEKIARGSSPTLHRSGAASGTADSAAAVPSTEEGCGFLPPSSVESSVLSVSSAVLSDPAGVADAVAPAGSYSLTSRRSLRALGAVTFSVRSNRGVPFRGLPAGGTTRRVFAVRTFI